MTLLGERRQEVQRLAQQSILSAMISKGKWTNRHREVPVCAPTEDAEDTINEIPSQDAEILTGDLEAQTDNNRNKLDNIAGSQGSGICTNDNGDRLTTLCGMSSLYIGNSYIMHKTINKKTWRSPDRSTNNVEQQWLTFKQVIIESADATVEMRNGFQKEE